MGGRITRALYKNQRNSQKLNIIQAQRSSQAIARVISFVISSVATFLIGYLLRPHIDGPNLKQTADGSRNKANADSTYWVIQLIGLCLLVGMQIRYVMKKRNKYDSASKSVQGNNKLLMLGWLICFLVELLAWITNYRLDLVLLIGYGLLWINIANTSLLILRYTHLSTNPQSKHCYYENEMTTLKRTIFAYLLAVLLYLGQTCSQRMKMFRIQKASKDLLSKLIKQGSIIQTSLSSVNAVQRLPFQYQSLVMEQQHDQKIMLKLTFLMLIFMITCTFIAFQKKSLTHLIVYDRKKKELHHFYDQRIALLDKQTKDINIKQYSMRKKICQNFSSRRIAIASGIYMIASGLVESYWRLNYINSMIEKSSQINLYQLLLLIVAVALISYFTLKAIVYLFCQFSQSKPINNENQFSMDRSDTNTQNAKCRQEILIGKRNILLITIAFFTILQIIIWILSYLSFEIKQQTNSLSMLLLPLGTREILFIFITYFCIRMTQQQLIQFPQISHQYYITITLTSTYLLRYLLPCQSLQPFCSITTGWLIGGVKSLLMYSSETYQTDGQICRFENQSLQYLACVQVFVLMSIMVLIWINNKIPISHLLNVKVVKKQDNNIPIAKSVKQNNLDKNKDQSQFLLNKEQDVIKFGRNESYQIDNQSSSFLNNAK